MFNGQGQWGPVGSQGSPNLQQQQQQRSQQAQQQAQQLAQQQGISQGQQNPQHSGKAPQAGGSTRSSLTPQQIIQGLMRLDPQQRNTIIQKNPQMQLFLQQYEQHRKLALQQAQRNNEGRQNAGNQSSQQYNSFANPIQRRGRPSQQAQLAEQAHIQMNSRRMMAQTAQDSHASMVQNIVTHGSSLGAVSRGGSAGVDAAVATPDVSSVPGTASSVAPAASGMGSSAAPQLPPALPLKDVHHWSRLLSQHNRNVPSSLKIYEEILERDSQFENRLRQEQKKPFDADMAQRMVRDLKFYQQIRDSRLKAINLRPELNKVTNRLWGEGYAGYGNGFTNSRTEIILPDHRKKGSVAKDIYISPEKITEQAITTEELVPIRLEFDQDRDGFQLSDTFLWNLNEKCISLESFATTLMADYQFPVERASQFKEKIVSSIKEQLDEYHPMIYKEQESSKFSDLRFPISLDITIANNQLVDRFDWDIMNPDNDPEEFAEVLCAEMSLPGEFVTAVAHSIREQCQTYIRSLFLIGYRFDGSAVTGDELKEFVKPSLDAHNIVRPRYLLSDYTTSLQELSYDNVEKLKKERERESRRKKRGQMRIGRRGGLVLPDLHDLPKTFRTPVPNSVLPGGVDLGHPTDSYLEYPISIEIPQRQLKALDEYKKEQARLKEQERLEQLELHKRREMERVQGQQLIQRARVKMRLPEGLQSKVTYRNEYEKAFVVKIRFV
ncbi:hypothetical protein FOA43_001046 [Brettanomyces nanus]|uniref:Uncharacterized protein n=1 Tax=Eeniella nana TaxID=13502 RepID=A0A875RYM3_EENNA|nr:uncharacterized protein FOA43_001046 [Brettanomyces nanus]QPG73733.1 hypothetical protein FOA43_001046 [Brettanomyces nanus]